MEPMQRRFKMIFSYANARSQTLKLHLPYSPGMMTPDPPIQNPNPSSPGD